MIFAIGPPGKRCLNWFLERCRMILNKVLFYLSKVSGGFQIFKWLAREHPRVLMYHRVFPDPSGRAIHPDEFLKQMKLIKKHFNVMSLNALITQYKLHKTVPKNTIVVTFDDGYADFYDHVYPIMRDLELPVTFFVTAGFVEQMLWFWPDQLRYLLDHSQEKNLSTPVGTLKVGAQTSWEIVADYCLTLTQLKRDVFFSELQTQLKVTLPEEVPDEYQLVSWKQLKEMSASVVDVECHSMSHVLMSQVSGDTLKKEVVDSKILIEAHLQQAVKGFCYPNGLADDFNDETKTALQAAGYDYGITAYPSAYPLKDLWGITRYPIGTNYCEFEKVIYGMRYQTLL